MLTATAYFDHAEYTYRATIITLAACVLAWLIGYFVSDREVSDE